MTENYTAKVLMNELGVPLIHGEITNYGNRSELKSHFIQVNGSNMTAWQAYNLNDIPVVPTTTSSGRSGRDVYLQYVHLKCHILYKQFDDNLLNTIATLSPGFIRVCVFYDKFGSNYTNEDLFTQYTGQPSIGNVVFWHQDPTTENRAFLLYDRVFPIGGRFVYDSTTKSATSSNNFVSFDEKLAIHAPCIFGSVDPSPAVGRITMYVTSQILDPSQFVIRCASYVRYNDT